MEDWAGMARFRGSGLMPMRLPAQISGQGVFDGVRHRGLGGGDVMLVTVPADELEQFLKFRNLNHAVSAKCVQLVLGKTAFAQVGANAAIDIIRRNAAISKRSGTDAPDDGAVGVLLADGPGDDF